MTKRSLYAQLVALVFWGFAATAASAQQTEGPACPACLVVTILPGQVLLLPEQLHGLTVLVRTSRAEVDASVMEEISRRGGRPGILVVPAVTSSSPDDAAFRLKSLLAEVRARAGRDGILALQVERPDYKSFLVERHLASYADVIVGVPDAVPPPRVRFWPALKADTARAALDVTRQGSAEGWVVSVPADALDAAAFVAALAEAAGRPREGFSEDVEVRGARRLSVDEIVARHQAAVRRQASLVTRSISTGVLTLTFEAPGFPAPVTITSDTVVYTDRDRTELEQRSIRVNGIEFRGGGVPRLPILEPERVASPPLAIALTDLYRYSLAGDETVNGVRCYVVAFAPSDTRQTLFRGRAWIAMDGFAMVKVAAVQTGLRGAIVSSEQVDEFRAVRDGVWMLSRSDVRQIYEGAAHRTPIHRRLSIATQELDPSDFSARRSAAYASQSVMLRDTAEGYRYLTRERRPARPGIEGAAPVPPVPEVAERADRVRTLAAGVIIDPNISRPLPFAGLSYVDFNLFGTGSQLNAFFGGAYGQLA
ncbi:MAG TPA: hypothetical protein VNJ03_18245, partial [Vicinamibacterales bacterium]|nr:hypothetical protein [Vicinamibacterales bacterium]